MSVGFLERIRSHHVVMAGKLIFPSKGWMGEHTIVLANILVREKNNSLDFHMEKINKYHIGIISKIKQPQMQKKLTVLSNFQDYTVHIC